MSKLSDIRNGSITSSKASKVADGIKDFTQAGLTYLNTKRAERALKRSVDTEFYSQAIYWGKCMEYFCSQEHDLGFDYQGVFNETKEHPIVKGWVGSADLVGAKKVGEIKCYYPLNFFLLASDLLKKDLELIKKNHKEEFWQVVSNAIIHEVEICEIVAYMPNFDVLVKIREILEHTDFIEEILQDEIWKYRFIFEKPIEELPHIPKESDFPSLVKFEFTPSEEDKIFLTNRVTKAIGIIEQP